MAPVYYIAATKDSIPISHDTIYPTESLVFQAKQSWYNAQPDFVRFDEAHIFSKPETAWSFLPDFHFHIGKNWFVVQMTASGLVRLSEYEEKRCRVITAFDDDWTDAGAVFIRKVIKNKRPVSFINGYVFISARDRSDELNQTLRDIFGRRTRFCQSSGSFAVKVTPYTMASFMLARPCGVDIDNLVTVWTYSPDEMTLTETSVNEFIGDVVVVPSLMSNSESNIAATA